MDAYGRTDLVSTSLRTHYGLKDREVTINLYLCAKNTYVRPHFLARHKIEFPGNKKKNRSPVKIFGFWMLEL